MLFIIAALISDRYFIAPMFCNSKNLNCIGALAFYDSNRSIGERLFYRYFVCLKQVVKSMPPVTTKCLGQTAELIEEQRKRVIFSSCSAFERARKVGLEKCLLIARNIDHILTSSCLFGSI